MTLKACGALLWPQPVAQEGYAATGLAINVLTFDSATDRLAWVGRSPVTDSIAKIHFRTGTVTTGDTVEVRIETVTNGRPSGTLLAANTNGTVAIADTDDNVWKTVTLTAAASLTAGQEFAIVIVHSSGATPNEQFSAVVQGVGLFSGGGHYPLVLQDTGGGTWAAPAVTALVWIVEMTTAGPVYMPNLLPLNAAGTATAFNSGSSPDEYAMKFQVPFKCRVAGARVYVANIAAGADFTVSLWPASSSVDGHALAQVAEDGDFALATTTDGYVDLYFSTPVTLQPDTVYYLGVRADTANSLGIGALVAASGITNAINAFGIPSGGNIFQATRTWAAGTAGAWTETATTTLPLVSLIIDQLGDDASVGGGMLRHPGMSGGLNA